MTKGLVSHAHTHVCTHTPTY